MLAPCPGARPPSATFRASGELTASNKACTKFTADGLRSCAAATCGRRRPTLPLWCGRREQCLRRGQLGRDPKVAYSTGTGSGQVGNSMAMSDNHFGSIFFKFFFISYKRLLASLACPLLQSSWPPCATGGHRRRDAALVSLLVNNSDPY